MEHFHSCKKANKHYKFRRYLENLSDTLVRVAVTSLSATHTVHNWMPVAGKINLPQFADSFREQISTAVRGMQMACCSDNLRWKKHRQLCQPLLIKARALEPQANTSASFREEMERSFKIWTRKKKILPKLLGISRRSPHYH